MIAVSGGGWGVGDLVGATRAALEFEDATVLCLCGRNDRLRAKVATRFAGEPRLRIMGFTDRMGDVLAAADVLVHSSAGLTVLEAIIRGCPVVSYGFGYGHVRASNAALERFELAQVAQQPRRARPAIEQALEHTPEPDGRFARRPSTASLILADERRARTLPALAAAHGAHRHRRRRPSLRRRLDADHRRLLLARLALRPHAAGDRGRDRPCPRSACSSTLPAARSRRSPALLSSYGIHASFSLGQASSPVEDDACCGYGDQALPRLPTGGLVRWLGARGELRALIGLDGRSPPLPVRVERAERRPVAGRPRAPAGGWWPARSGSRTATTRSARCTPARSSSSRSRARASSTPLLDKLLSGLHSGSPRRGPGRAADPRRRPARSSWAQPRGPDGSTRRHARARRSGCDGVAHRTPVVTSRTLDALVGAQVRSRSRRFSAAARSSSAAPTTRSPRWTTDALARGVCAVSSGNHAQAVALAAPLCGTRAVILMPADAPALKRAATEGYGAEVIEFDRYGDDREQLVRELAAERGLALVHPYDNPRVMAGQGTVALELLEQAAASSTRWWSRSAAAG